MTLVKGPTCCPDGITGYGNPEEGIVVVGQFPNYNEMKTGLPFTGQDGELLNSTLKAVGWSRDRIYCTNSCCVHDLTRIDICRPRLIQEINSLHPRLVVTLGAVACENLFGMKIAKARGALLYRDGYRGLATWLPSAILQANTPKQQNDYAAEFVRDLKKIARYFGPNRKPPTRVNTSYILVTDIEQAQKILDFLPRDQIVTLDIETPIIDKEAKEADPYHQILCVGIGLADDTQYIFPEEILDKLNWPTDVQWSGWNLYGFDCVALRDRYNISIPIVHDGMLTSYVRDERTKYGTHKLKNNAREDAGADFYEEDEIRQSKENLYKYNGYDVAYNHRLLRYHLANFDEDDKKLYNDLLIPAANMYSEAQYTGCRIDIFKLFQLDVEFMCRAKDLEEELVADATSYGFPEDINPNSDKQVSRLFFQVLGIDPREVSYLTKGGTWSVDKDVLDRINHPWAAKLRLHRQLTDVRSRYLVGPQAQVKHDLKVHPKCWIPGAGTGRVSYSDPPVNQLPHRRTVGDLSRVREIFIPDSEDYVLLANDYSQIELWILWAFSGDSNLLADLTEPWSVTGKADYHSRTCLHGIPCPTHSLFCADCHQLVEICHCPKGFHLDAAHGCADCIKWEFDRDNQKHVNFGIPYGETAFGLMRPPPSGTGLARQECQNLIDAWYNHNKDVLAWQKSIEYILRTKGFIKTPFGRKRRFPIVLNTKQIRQAVNAPVQGTASDHTLSSAIELVPLIKPLDSRLLWTTHDDILLHVNRKHLQEVKEITKYVMEKPRLPDFPSIKVEQKEGANLYEVSP